MKELGAESVLLRYNEGGNVSELVLDKLTRKPLATCQGRYGVPERYPCYAPRGPMVRTHVCVLY